jgi:Tfp pilus assembly protein PilO
MTTILILKIIFSALCLLAAGFCLGAWFVSVQNARQMQTMIRKTFEQKAQTDTILDMCRDQVQSMKTEIERLKAALRSKGI